MPRFKGSCGCYSKDDARELGLATAVVWNDILDRAEHFDSQKIWYDQKMASERLGIPNQTISRCLKTLETAERVTLEGGYRPSSTIRTTWVTIAKKYLDENLNPQNGEPKESQNGESIYNDTKESDSPSVSGIVTVIERKKKGENNWVDGRRLYTTEEEAEKIESCSKGEYPDFYYWPSRKLVGDESKKKHKSNLPVGLYRLEYEKPDSENGGPKVKYQTDYCY